MALLSSMKSIKPRNSKIAQLLFYIFKELNDVLVLVLIIVSLMTFCRCILHRDLKSENCLVSDLLRAKVSDFGTSRAKSVSEELTMSSVGTPLYCAPEIFLGHSYDEKVDIYSFGLLLLEMAIEENIVDFISERWRFFNNKKRAPKTATHILLDMSEKGWRPVTEENPVACAPKSINTLIIRCMSLDPVLRPSFKEILRELQGPCFDEIATSVFLRRSADSLHDSQRVKEFALDSHDHSEIDVVVYPSEMHFSAHRRLSSSLGDATASSPSSFENPFNIGGSSEPEPIVSEKYNV